MLEPAGIVVVDSPSIVVEVESGIVVEVVVDEEVVLVESGSVEGVVGRLGGLSGGKRSLMVTGGHITAASTGAGDPPTKIKAALIPRTATMAAPNLPGVMGAG